MSFSSAASIWQLFELLGLSCVRQRMSVLFYFVMPLMWGPVSSFFLFAGVDILLAFSCGIMIKPDSILLSRCCIISMGQYFQYYQCNLEYLLGVCVCVRACVYLWSARCGTLGSRQDGGNLSCRHSNKYIVPPCVCWRKRSLFGSLNLWFVCMFVAELYVLFGVFPRRQDKPDEGMWDVALCRQNKL